MEINVIAAAAVAALASGLTGYCIGVVTERRRHYAEEFQKRQVIRTLERSLHESKMSSKPHNRVARPVARSHSSPASTDHGFTSGVAVGSSFSGGSDSCSSSSSDSGSFF